MINFSMPDFAANTPFPHCGWDTYLPAREADVVLGWLEATPLWRLREERFYQQHEFCLSETDLPPHLRVLTSSGTISTMADHLENLFGLEEGLESVDVTAHRLTAGQTIRAHNDYRGPQETHRVLVQLNRGWSKDNGGLLMLLGTRPAEGAQSVLLPTHGSGFAFEISAKSFHAVTTIKSGERFTLVYTFRSKAA